jgi:hypothetical protein
VDAPGLDPKDPARLGAAIQLAVLSGWLRTGGTPAHSVLLTAAGLAVLKERGLV